MITYIQSIISKEHMPEVKLNPSQVMDIMKLYSDRLVIDKLTPLENKDLKLNWMDPYDSLQGICHQMMYIIVDSIVKDLSLKYMGEITVDRISKDSEEICPYICGEFVPLYVSYTLPHTHSDFYKRMFRDNLFKESFFRRQYVDEELKNLISNNLKMYINIKKGEIML